MPIASSSGSGMPTTGSTSSADERPFLGHGCRSATSLGLPTAASSLPCAGSIFGSSLREEGQALEARGGPPAIMEEAARHAVQQLGAPASSAIANVPTFAQQGVYDQRVSVIGPVAEGEFGSAVRPGLPSSSQLCGSLHDGQLDGGVGGDRREGVRSFGRCFAPGPKKWAAVPFPARVT